MTTSDRKINVIITGSTGMVGEGVLHTCLMNENVNKILVLNRKPCGIIHPKLKEIIHKDFFSLQPIENEIKGYDACFFCLGVSSVGMSRDEYFRLTYTLTMNVAQTLSRMNKDMVFCYVSGAGTDSSENGKSTWARVKGKTENDLMKLPFGKVYNFRPGFIHPIKGLTRTHSYYKYFLWMFPIGRTLAPDFFSDLEEIGLAMIKATLYGYEKSILSGKDITALSKR